MVIELSQNQRDQLETLLEKTLPHGSGIDGKWYFDWRINALTAANSFHRMDENGYYCGWNDFTVTLNLVTLKIKRSGGHPQINDYLDDQFHEWLECTKGEIASILGIVLIPGNERRLIEISLQSWRGDMVKRFGMYGDWPEWAKVVSQKVNNLCMELDQVTNYREVQ